MSNKGIREQIRESAESESNLSQVTTSQAEAFLSDCFERMPEEIRTLVIGQSLWMNKVAPCYGITEDEAYAMFDVAISHPERLIYSFTALKTTIRFLRP